MQWTGLRFNTSCLSYRRTRPHRRSRGTDWGGLKGADRTLSTVYKGNSAHRFWGESNIQPDIVSWAHERKWRGDKRLVYDLYPLLLTNGSGSKRIHIAKF